MPVFNNQYVSLPPTCASGEDEWFIGVPGGSPEPFHPTGVEPRNVFRELQAVVTGDGAHLEIASWTPVGTTKLTPNGWHGNGAKLA